MRGRLVGALILAILGASAQAQELSAREALNRAKQIFVQEGLGATWPDLSRGGGTVLYLGFGFRKANAVLATPYPRKYTELLRDQRRLFAGLPNCGDTRERGTEGYSAMTCAFGVESQGSVDPSSIEVRLGTLAQLLEKSTAFAKPAWIVVDASDGSSVWLDGNPMRGDRHVWPAASVRGDVELRATSHVDPFGWVGGIATFAICLSVTFGLSAAFTIASWGAEPRTPSPEEVQRSYDRTPSCAGFSWAALVLLPLLLYAFFSRQAQVEFLMSARWFWMPFAILAPLGLVVVPSGAALVAAKRRGWKKRPKSPDAPEFEIRLTREPIEWRSNAAPVALIVLLGALMLGAVCALPWLHEPWRSVIRQAVPTAPAFLAMPIVFAFMNSKGATVREGDPALAEANELARLAGVGRVSVSMLRSPTLGAWVYPSGRIVLTSKLAREFQPAEVRAVLAHEIGHLRHRDFRRLAPFQAVAVVSSLLLFVGFVLLRSRIPEFMIAGGAICFVYVAAVAWLRVVAGKIRRRAELAADRFAVDATGDAELVIRVLTRLHDENQSPHRLKPEDEALSTHPSLVNRIASIREHFSEGI